MADFNSMLADALKLMPAKGEKVEFNAYKAKLYAANPSGGKDVFAHMIKKDLVNKELSRDSAGNVIVLLSAKSEG